MVYWIKRKWNQIKRVFDFLPIIWKSYDWDYHYSIDIFKKQLERQADFLESDKSHTLNAKRIASRIRTAVRLMDKVYNNEYAMAHYDVLVEKYGEPSFEFIETGDFDEKGDPYYSMKISYEKARDENHNKEIEEISAKMMIESHKKQKRAHKLLWDFIEHNILHWWD